MIADASSVGCSAAKADSFVRGAAKPRLLRLLGVGTELGSLDSRSDSDPNPDTDTDTDTDTDADTDAADQALLV
jgi:hypothetical protein